MPKATQRSQDWNSGSLTLEFIFLIFHKLFKKARGIRVGTETHTGPVPWEQLQPGHTELPGWAWQGEASFP